VALTRDDLEYIRNHAEVIDVITWHAACEVDKYSPDQVQWAGQRFREERAWHGQGFRTDVKHALRRLRYGPLQLDGSDYQRYFPSGPEMGHRVGAEGNILVNAGLTNIFSLWLGLTGAAVNPLRDVAAGTSVVGVGSGAAAAATTDTTLQANGGSAWFQAIDATSLAATTLNVVVATCTVASGNGNFSWQEWCWATGSGAVTAGANGGTTAGSPFATGATWAMVNHKTNVNLGSKASGSAWVFSTSVVIN
jgi:hypothetical protein